MFIKSFCFLQLFFFWAVYSKNDHFPLPILSFTLITPSLQYLWIIIVFRTICKPKSFHPPVLLYCCSLHCVLLRDGCLFHFNFKFLFLYSVTVDISICFSFKTLSTSSTYILISIFHYIFLFPFSLNGSVATAAVQLVTVPPVCLVVPVPVLFLLSM